VITSIEEYVKNKLIVAIRNENKICIIDRDTKQVTLISNSIAEFSSPWQLILMEKFSIKIMPFAFVRFSEGIAILNLRTLNIHKLISKACAGYPNGHYLVSNDELELIDLEIVKEGTLVTKYEISTDFIHSALK
jgi:hypothetical protein